MRSGTKKHLGAVNMKFKIYTTQWCAHCKPYIERVKELASDVEVIEHNETNKHEFDELGIMSVPYTVVYEDGIYVDSWVGNDINKVEMYL